MSNTEFKLPNTVKESLLMARLHCTQSNEQTSLLAELTPSVDKKVELWQTHSRYTEAVEAQVVSMINLGLVQAVIDGGEEYTELGLYISNGESLAFPKAGSQMLPDTVDEYVRELANDICCTYTLSALDLVDEIENWIWEINETLN